MSASRFARTLACAGLIALAALVPAGAAAADTGLGPQVVFGNPFDGAVYYQGQAVQAAYGCVPGPTGIPAMTCTGDVPSSAPLDTSISGDRLFTVRAIDPFGVTTTATVHFTVIDVVPPLINVTAPADHATYEIGSLVTVDYGCDDPGGAGLLACLGPLPNGYPLQMSGLGSFTFVVRAFDAAGNSSTKQVAYQVVDDVPPTVSVAAPTAAAGDRVPVYTVGQRVLADYSCSDNGGSGIASCSAPAPSGTPLDTSTVGPHSFTVSASDFAHNTATVSRPYEVHYAFGGFAAPLAAWPAFAPVGRGDVSVTFSLGGPFGPSVLAGVTSRPVTCETATSLGSPEPARGSTSYSAPRDRYTFRWSTSAAWRGTCRELDLALNDGTIQKAGVRFKR